MNEHEDEDSLTIEDLLRAKAELEDENSGLFTKLQQGEKLKTQLREAKKDSKKLIHHRDKLKNLKTERSGTSLIKQSKKNLDEPTLNTANDEAKDEDSPTSAAAQLIREIDALKMENSSLVEALKKSEEQKDALVEELAASNTKQDKLHSVCNSLESEVIRLSSFVGKSQSNTSQQEEGIEVLKEQLRLYQEDIHTLQAQLQTSERSNTRLKAEVDEARLVIREMRTQPRVQVYPAAAIREPVYRPYDDHDRYRYSREPIAGYALIRSYSGDCIAPREDSRRRGAPVKKAFLSPDLTAVVDNDVVDISLASSKSI